MTFSRDIDNSKIWDPLLNAPVDPYGAGECKTVAEKFHDARTTKLERIWWIGDKRGLALGTELGQN